MSQRIDASLVSHTNVGKTTLARTLLARDVGEVRDAPHVTAAADEQALLASADGDALVLWDTPGFGDSTRLARRMRSSGNPIGWFLSHVWDRWRDRAFWSSQQALRNVRERADVVLYLVNAAEDPDAAGYLDAEMELLAWVGKPVLALLNQLGAPRGPEREAADVERWRARLASWPLVRAVLPMDAFARCWVQEDALWHAVEQALPLDRQAAMQRLRAAWRRQREAVFDASMRALAESLARVACAQVPLEGGWSVRGGLRQLGAAVGVGRARADALAVAERALLRCLHDEVRDSTAAMIALHGLAGSATGVVIERVAAHYEHRTKVDETGAAVVGGVLSGALAGLAADIASGGLTLGGGVIAGSVLGALGGAGVARGINVVRGTGDGWAAFSADAWPALVRAALLRYLAVAHYGRGRGDWAESEAPAHWGSAVDGVLADEAAALEKTWHLREHGCGDGADAMARALQPMLDRCARRTLALLYP